MKKLFFTAVFLMAAVILFGQSLEKGNLVGVHIAEFKLKPGVTEDQAVAFVLEKLIPALENNYGTKDFLLKGLRGKYAGKFATLIIFKDEKHRDKFYSNTSEAAKNLKNVTEALKEIMAEADKIWYPFETVYNDYLISGGKGQEIKKGVVIGLHNETIKCNQGYDEQQYIDYCINKLLPAWESYEPGMKGSVSKSIRGSDSTKIGLFITFSDENIRSKFWDSEDNQTQYYKDFIVKYQDVLDGWNKIGIREDTFTDWIAL